MTTDQHAADEPKKEKWNSKECGEMMKKMMNFCRGEKGENIDYEKIFKRMPDCCKDMMKNMQDKKA